MKLTDKAAQQAEQALKCLENAQNDREKEWQAEKFVFESKLEAATFEVDEGSLRISELNKNYQDALLHQKEADEKLCSAHVAIDRLEAVILEKEEVNVSLRDDYERINSRFDQVGGCRIIIIFEGT